jgi:hypothetical protein
MIVSVGSLDLWQPWAAEELERAARHLFLPPRSDYFRAEVDIRIATDTAGPWSCGADIRRRICVLDTAPRVG